MIYITLFITFFKIGLVSFGGGYGMISLVSESVLSHGWLTEEELMNFIAVAESTPGSLAVNMATFVGSSQAGLAGSLLATIGVVLPSFLIILIIAMAIQNLLKYAGVQAVLGGIRPCIVALILGTAITMGLKRLFSLTALSETPKLNVSGILILALLLLIRYAAEKLFRWKISPIMMILISAGLGILLYGILGITV